MAADEHLLLDSIDGPADLRLLRCRRARGPRRRDQALHRPVGVAHRRPPRLQPRRRRADPRPAPGLRLPSRRHPLGHRPPGLRPQDRDRPAARVLRTAPAGWAVGLSLPSRVDPRLGREQPCLDHPELRPWARHRVPPPRRIRAQGGGRAGRRVPDRRDGLRGAQQPRPHRRQRPHRPQRQRAIVRPDGGSSRRRGRRGAGVLRGSRSSVRRPGRRPRRRRPRAGPAGGGHVRRARRRPRPDPEGPGLRTGGGRRREVPPRHAGLRSHDGATPVGARRLHPGLRRRLGRGRRS